MILFPNCMTSPSTSKKIHVRYKQLGQSLVTHPAPIPSAQTIPTVTQLIKQAMHAPSTLPALPLIIKLKNTAAFLTELTKEDVSSGKWVNTRILSLTRELLKHGHPVAGDKFDLVNAVRTKILGLDPLEISEKTTPRRSSRQNRMIILKAVINWRLARLGETSHRAECSNTEDFDTLKEISCIPVPYLFCIKDGSTWYGFDVRTLSTMIESSSATNPYTQNILDTPTLDRFRKKVKLLKKLGFPLARAETTASTALSESDKFTLYINRVLQKLHYLDYTVKSTWITTLSFEQLQRVYCEIADIWQYRLGDALTSDMRKEIVKNGVIFAEAHIIKYMPPSSQNKKILLTKIVKNLDRFISEGTTKDNRTLGAIYFMTGLSIVSPQVAEAFPALAHIVIGE